MKATRHAVAQALERHGITGMRRHRARTVQRAVQEAMVAGLVATSVTNTWEAEVVHPDGRRWIVDLRTERVITSLPRLKHTKKEGR